jgi:hypothetical protein
MEPGVGEDEHQRTGRRFDLIPYIMYGDLESFGDISVQEYRRFDVVDDPRQVDGIGFLRTDGRNRPKPGPIGMCGNDKDLVPGLERVDRGLSHGAQFVDCILRGRAGVDDQPDLQRPVRGGGRV